MIRAPTRHIDLISTLLLTLAISTACHRLLSTGWVKGLGVAYPLALGGMFLGLTFGRSRFKGWLALLLGILYSLVIIPFTYATIFHPNMPWLERMALLTERLLGSMSQVAAGDPLQDAFLLMFLLTSLLWFVGLRSAYALTRKASYLGAVLPVGLVVILLQFFDPRRALGVFLTALFFFFALLLLGRMKLVQRKEAWHQQHVIVSGDAAADIHLNLLAAASVLVLAAWVLPVSTRHITGARTLWQNITRRWENNETLQNLTAGLEVDERAPVNNFYGSSMPLGQDAPLSDAVLFHIQNKGTVLQERYYWRARSYDTYEDGLWSSNSFGTREVGPLSARIELPVTGGERVVFRVVVVNTNFGILLTPARPVWVDLPSKLLFTPVSEDVLDPLVYLPNEPVFPAEEYLVHAIVMEPTRNELQASGTRYPEWVMERYLQLPADLNPAVISLALRLTEHADTPFDKATAITAYLREEITYSTHLEPVPPGRDALDWFLFENKQGFCNYYATAEVILLRAAGIPARLTVGFSEGLFEAPGWFTVKQHNAHAWPEVYFPGYGWIEFEPTTSEPALNRLEGDPVALPVEDEEALIPDLPAGGGTAGSIPSGSTSVPTGGVDTRWRQPVALSIYLVVASLLLGTAVTRLLTVEGFGQRWSQVRQGLRLPLPAQVRNWLKRLSLPVPAWLEQQARLSALDPLERAFHAVYDSLHRLGIPANPSLTPAEAAAELMERMPEAENEILTLLYEYQPAYYGRQPADLEKIQRAASLLRQRARLRKTETAEWRRIADKLMNVDRSRHE